MPDKRQTVDALLAGCRGNRDWYRGYMEYNWPRIAEDFEFLRTRIPPTASVLDVGAVPPLLTAMLHLDGFRDLSIVDPHADLFQPYLDAHNVRYFRADVLNGLASEWVERFDLVCLSEVIEHLAGNLLTAIGNVTACVKPGGHLLVTTPNLRSICGLAALLWYGSGLASKPKESVRAQYERANAKDGYFGHLREFTPREVIELFESFGLRHVASRFQANYLRQSRIFLACSFIERCVPRFRLFGKYLFRRTRTP